MKKYSPLLGFIMLVLTMLAASSAFADAPVEGRAGRAEVRFLEGMIDHHQMALDMANDCLGKASTDGDVLALCQNIIDAQSAEIAVMQGWLLEWYNIDYNPTSMNDIMGEMNHSGHTMEGMPATDPAMMMGMMAGFNRLEGVDYEIAWTESMIDHHDDALHMSERILEHSAEETGHNELRDLAQQIISDQTAEIEQMEAMLVELAD